MENRAIESIQSGHGSRRCGVVVWLTGRPSSGKSTLAAEVHRLLDDEGVPVVLLDGDEVREALVPKPGYDIAGRAAFYSTLAGLASLVARQGYVVLVPATAHRRAYRDDARARAPRFVEVYVDTASETCARRDTKGLYRKASSGEVSGVPGADLEYEVPTRPDVVASGGHDAAAIAAIREWL